MQFPTITISTVALLISTFISSTAATPVAAALSPRQTPGAGCSSGYVCIYNDIVSFFQPPILFHRFLPPGDEERKEKRSKAMLTVPDKKYVCVGGSYVLNNVCNTCEIINGSPYCV